LSPVYFLEETWQGVHQLHFLEELSRDLTEEKLDALADDLKSFAGELIKRNGLRILLIGGKESLDAGLILSRRLKGGLPEGGESGDFELADFKPEILREGWSTDTAVSFAACCFKTIVYNHPDAPVLAVISEILTDKFVFREIREKGGAYGGYVSYNPFTGLYSFSSYRDPNIAKTLKVFRGAMKFINSEKKFDECDVKEAILSVCSNIDMPHPPAAEAKIAFTRSLSLLTDKQRLEFKKNLLKVTKERVLEAAGKYFNKKLSDCSVAVISSEKIFAGENSKMKDKLEIHKI